MIDPPTVSFYHREVLRETAIKSWARLRRARAALLAAGLSYYFIAGLLPLLVLGSGVLGLVSRRNTDFTSEAIDWLGVQGHAAAIVTDSINHAEQTHVTSSVVGVAGLLWAGLAVTGALRRAVDAVWGVDDVGWTARLRSAPWAATAALLVALSVAATGLAASVNGAGAILAAAVAFVFTAALSAWFLSRLGSCRPGASALLVATALLTVGFEAVKNGAVFVVPRLVSRDSALYGGLGSALAGIVGLLVVSWLLLFATAVAAELTEPSLPTGLSDTDAAQGGGGRVARQRARGSGYS